jgi:hypothetical protein
MRTERSEIAEIGPDGKASSGVDASKSRSELYNEARHAGIDGRSAMNKQQLVDALRKHRATRTRDSRNARPATAQRTAVSVRWAAGSERSRVAGWAASCGRGSWA